MMRRRTLAILGALVVASPRSNRAQESPEAAQGSWLAEEIAGRAVSPEIRSTLEISADGTAAGSGGCNRYRGRVELGPGTVTFSPMAATRMMCAAPAMEQEQRLFAAFAAVRRFRVAEAKLLLIAEDGTVAARFARGA
jgi:heat shock protein HslJ